MRFRKISHVLIILQEAGGTFGYLGFPKKAFLSQMSVQGL
jgi:hypothetical protein